MRGSGVSLAAGTGRAFARRGVVGGHVGHRRRVVRIGSAGDRERAASDRAVDDWDELSRGDDPTDDQPDAADDEPDATRSTDPPDTPAASARADADDATAVPDVPADDAATGEGPTGASR